MHHFIVGNQTLLILQGDLQVVYLHYSLAINDKNMFVTLVSQTPRSPKIKPLIPFFVKATPETSNLAYGKAVAVVSVFRLCFFSIISRQQNKLGISASKRSRSFSSVAIDLQVVVDLIIKR